MVFDIAIERNLHHFLSTRIAIYDILGSMPAKDILHDSVKTALLVLAVPNEVFQTLFQRKTIQRVLERYQVNLIVVDPEQERVVL